MNTSSCWSFARSNLVGIILHEVAAGVWKALWKVCSANLSRSNYLQRTQLHKLSIVDAIAARVGRGRRKNNSLVTNLTPFSFFQRRRRRWGRKERRKKKTPKECFIVLKFPSLFALPIVATEINTYLVNDNLANCQTFRGSARGPQCVYGWRVFVFVCVCVCVCVYGRGWLCNAWSQGQQAGC